MLGLSKTERLATLWVGGAFMARVFGMMLILPAINLPSRGLVGASPTQLGWAVGLYGLMQALCQLPLGALSDRVGRRPVLMAGWACLGLGSCLAAAHLSPAWLIVGRGLQGAGAIGSTLMATLADHTDPNRRGVAMAVVGASIGLAFATATWLGSLAYSAVGLRGLLWCTGGLAVLGALSTDRVLKRLPSQPPRTRAPWAERWPMIAAHRRLWHNGTGMLMLHATYTCLMARLPAMLTTTSWASSTAQVLFWPMLLGFPVALAWVRRADAARWSNRHLMSTMLLLALGLVVTVSSVTHPVGSHTLVLLGLTLYLFSFSVLEAGLTADTSRTTDTAIRGSAMGVQSSMQYAGIFLGGLASSLGHSPHGWIDLGLGFGLVLGIWLITRRHLPPYRG